jgi:pyruvate dehydrogenase E2 component (dihydrolipoamide acetyltransferase)
MEFEEFFQSGYTFAYRFYRGETAKVDALLAIIGPEGTDVSGISKILRPQIQTNQDKESTPEKKENGIKKTAVQRIKLRV